MKTNQIYHEYTTTFGQNLTYLGACLLNTLSSTTLLIMVSTFMLDLTFLVSSIFGFGWGVLCLLGLLLAFPMVYLATTSWSRWDMEAMAMANSGRHTIYNTTWTRAFIYHAVAAGKPLWTDIS